jgi:hypothetical protein
MANKKLQKVEQPHFLNSGIGVDIKQMISDSRVPDDMLRFQLLPLDRFPGDVLVLLIERRPALASEMLYITG